jgi:hypothetical protein
MIRPAHLTVGQIADIYAEPDWLIRRIVDSLGVDIPRVGAYRAISRDLLPQIGAAIEQRRRPSEPGETP